MPFDVVGLSRRRKAAEAIPGVGIAAGSVAGISVGIDGSSDLLSYLGAYAGDGLFELVEEAGEFVLLVGWLLVVAVTLVRRRLSRVALLLLSLSSRMA